MYNHNNIPLTYLPNRVSSSSSITSSNFDNYPYCYPVCPRLEDSYRFLESFNMPSIFTREVSVDPVSALIDLYADHIYTVDTPSALFETQYYCPDPNLSKLISGEPQGLVPCQPEEYIAHPDRTLLNALLIDLFKSLVVASVKFSHNWIKAPNNLGNVVPSIITSSHACAFATGAAKGIISGFILSSIFAEVFINALSQSPHEFSKVIKSLALPEEITHKLLNFIRTPEFLNKSIIMLLSSLRTYLLENPLLFFFAIKSIPRTVLEKIKCPQYAINALEASLKTGLKAAASVAFNTLGKSIHKPLTDKEMNRTLGLMTVLFLCIAFKGLLRFVAREHMPENRIDNFVGKGFLGNTIGALVATACIYEFAH